jgi:hypothetical protein
MIFFCKYSITRNQSVAIITWLNRLSSSVDVQNRTLSYQLRGGYRSNHRSLSR